ncbi:hypothetical protein MNBD_GAMMA26-1627 [hydrothermal vent metagenome]|uniref:Cytochrome c7-like domain-containing protein n=1 Tax=hydrothermal vent metagenome TaxID=652676 RepID=A0A3B1APC3_9ZZZZ
MMARPTILFMALSTVAVFYLAFIMVTDVQAEESAFRLQFVEAKQKHNFARMAFLIQSYKDVIPGNIEQLIKEAGTEGIPQGNRLRLLDLAYHIAKMHQEWNKGDAKIVTELAAILADYRQKIAAQQAVLNRIKAVEILPGNFVLNSHADKMIAAEVNPVIYPHWVHRAFFRCKVCHENLFVMKRGTNELSHEKIDAGKLCGACHNGKTSFDTVDKTNCPRCHLFGTPQEQPLIDLTYYEEETFIKIAERLGSKWHADKLADGKFPFRQHGFIDWIELDKLKVVEPLSSLGEDSIDEGIRDTEILFVMPQKYAFMLDNVLWSHKIHTTWINCSICHKSTPQRDSIFTEKAGETRVSMIELKEGKSCGTCHGRVSFPVADCTRCHNHKGVEVGQNTIVRELLPEPQASSSP